MVRKFLGIFSAVAFVLAVSACGTASESEDDECTLDPTSANCSTTNIEPEPDLGE